MYYRGFGGGLGLGTPVVSYAPRPMLVKAISLVIMKAIGRLGGRVSCCVLGGKEEEHFSGGLVILYRKLMKNETASEGA